MFVEHGFMLQVVKDEKEVKKMKCYEFVSVYMESVGVFVMCKGIII